MMKFNGHNVESIEEGVFAVINHYVNPVVGFIRVDDAHGRPYNRERLQKAYADAASDIRAEFMRNLFEAMSKDWKTFRAHRPVGEYLAIGQLDGDCSCGAGAWPCQTIRSKMSDASV